MRDDFLRTHVLVLLHLQCDEEDPRRKTPNMRTVDPIDAREALIAKVIGSKREIAALQQHVKEIIEGPAFKGSHRSGQFLQYLIDQCIAGNFDSLKERLIGVELFGRSPSYDTGVDAIVRVVASDVRKRLLQHYGRNGESSEFRITLLSGSYIPEIVRGNPQHLIPSGPLEAQLGTPASDSAQERSEESTVSPPPNQVPQTRIARRVWLAAGVVLLIAVGVTSRVLFFGRPSPTELNRNAQYPSSVLFNSSHPTHLVTSDPNIVVLQEIIGSELSLSDYANHKYIPEPNKLPPDMIRFCHNLLWGDNSAAAVDAPIAASIAALPHAGSTLTVRAARSVQLSDLKNDDNFIFLGSPRSNPWFSLFNDELDFRFDFDKFTGQEIVVNVHPRPHELPKYVPTAQGWATGQSFAIVAFVQNPEQAGQVLLLAGANGEGTEAAGKLFTDLPRLSTVLRNCGLSRTGPIQHFEILLQLNTMAETPSNVTVVACHLLPGYSLQKQ
jgi:hypothetical protein